MTLVASCALILAVAAAPAAAEPPEPTLASAPGTPTATSTLMSLGLAGGRIPGTSGDMTLDTIGGAVGLDRRLTSHLWAHAHAGLGIPTWRTDEGWFEDVQTTNQGLLLLARAGIIARGCERFACAFAGVDGGVQYVTYNGRRTTRTPGSPDNGGGGNIGQEALMVERSHAIVVPRAGLEIGGSLRFRMSLERPITRDGGATTFELALVAEL